MKDVYRFWAYAFHPLCVQIYILWLVLFANQHITDHLFFNQRMVLGLLFTLSLGVLPVLGLLFFSKEKTWKSIEFMKDSKRKFSLALMALLLAMNRLVFVRVRDLDFISVYLESALILSLLLLVVHQAFRVSLHAAGAGALPAVVLFLNPFTAIPFWWIFLPSLFITVITPLLRYRMNAHSTSELFSGWIIGFCATSLIFALNYGF